MYTINYKYIVVISGFTFLLWMFPKFYHKSSPSDAQNIQKIDAQNIEKIDTQNIKMMKTQSTQTVPSTKQNKQTKNAHTQVEFDMADFIVVDYCPRV